MLTADAHGPWRPPVREGGRPRHSHLTTLTHYQGTADLEARVTGPRQSSFVLNANLSRNDSLPVARKAACDDGLLLACQHAHVVTAAG